MSVNSGPAGRGSSRRPGLNLSIPTHTGLLGRRRRGLPRATQCAGTAAAAPGLIHLQVERVQKAGGLYQNFTSSQALSYLDGTLPGGAWLWAAGSRRSGSRGRRAGGTCECRRRSRQLAHGGNQLAAALRCVLQQT